MKKLLTLLSFFFIIHATAQINPRTSWGKVSNEEINYKQVNFDPAAAAVILFEEGRMRIEREFETRVYRRIKVLDEKGIEAANQEIRYYTNDHIERISSIKAQTINIENGKTDIRTVDRRDFHDTQINEFWSKKTFAFPNVKVGSILEFEYVLVNKGMYTMDAWFFQHDYPTLHSKFEITNNSYRDFATLAIGNQIIQNTTKDQGSKWVLNNIPSFNSIPFLFNKKDMSERISLQLKGYHKSKGAFDHLIGYESVLSSWKALNRKMLDLYQTYTNNGVGKDIEKQIPNGKNETETLQNVFNYFKNNYQWNYIYGIYPKHSNREVHQKKSGSSAELNLLLNTALKAKGLSTDLIFISSRKNGKLIVSYPYLGQFNSVVNLVTTKDGNAFLIDASDLQFDLGYAALDNYNYYGLVVDANKERLISPQPPLSTHLSVQNYVIKDHQFMVNRTEKKNGYFKQKDKKLPDGLNKYNPIEAAVDLLTTEKNTQSRASENDLFQLERIQSETSHFTNNRFISIQNPLKTIISAYQLPEKNRIRALEFNFPFHYQIQVSIEIPPGFQVEIPQGFNSQRKAAKDALIYLQKAEIKEGKLLLQIEFLLSQYLLDKDYAATQTFFNQIIQASNQVILLKKN